mmetsp:Transcript_18751/g.22989  ORF Transcript_18751/g.22989 Transcript_18751/m.22989 type:complete len:743 (+) Transcript_18751:86-2314(+)
MNGGWSGPSGSMAEPAADASPEVVSEEEEKYYALIVDSGAIIKHTGFSTLHRSASKYVTTQGVIEEIRDSKARAHLDALPFELNVREPSSEGITKVVEFSKKTGDYASLSAVDLHVLALLYDLEKEGCGMTEHIRSEPKRMVGTGKLNFVKNREECKNQNDECSEASETPSMAPSSIDGNISFFEGIKKTKDTSTEEKSNQIDAKPNAQSNEKKSWAMLVNPAVASSATSSPPIGIPNLNISVANIALTKSFGSMTLNSKSKGLVNVSEGDTEEEIVGNGQFSDADDDESIHIPQNDMNEYESSDDEGDEFASIGEDFSDEECDVYILDPEEVEERKRLKEADKVENVDRIAMVDESKEIEEELDMIFPSLSAAASVPYEGSDDEGEVETDNIDPNERLKKAAEEQAKRREESLKPILKNGKSYNSFGKYKKLLHSKGVTIKDDKKDEGKESIETLFDFADSSEVDIAAGSTDDLKKSNTTHSRVIGGMSGQSGEVDDDGEGWVTSTQEIMAMKVTGTLDPFASGKKDSHPSKVQENLPTRSHRAACATTDFAMQNVILQMNLELLTVDGMKVRKLKSWVQRCGTCFEVYTSGEENGQRLFCSRCGSSHLNRVAASVNGKTGRLKLHLRKNYQHNLRGTKYQLPKPGKQNKFKGDILLCEDQLMYGAMNHRVKQSSRQSKKTSQSIFGSDIASTVGCNIDLTKRSDIKVGFGRKNPNATKFGRERRGKKKQNTDKACGLRRY